MESGVEEEESGAEEDAIWSASGTEFVDRIVLSAVTRENSLLNLDGWFATKWDFFFWNRREIKTRL